MKKLAVLISNTGTGTNLQAIINGVEQKKIKGKIVVVISDTEDALGLERAKKHNLKTSICERKEQLLNLLNKYNPSYICLAGWKQIISDNVIDGFPDKILNIHPGLIPDSSRSPVKNPDATNGLWNQKKLTSAAIKNFLDTKATYAGSSLHFLSHDFDFGIVLGRVFEKVAEGDTIDSLYTRLKVKENQLYVEVLEKLCNR